ncbi:MAG: spore coat protein [Oscillospiraceae bacterium]|nr:spore coat protein [Clostridiaceae bacterium]MDO4495891.1 spore coat protein [Clostridiaceae bacterium]MDY5947787.1 spore coat protein [Oscillospiraceae bacterium]
MNTNQSFTDKEILDDVLSSQKHITDVYNTYSNECVNKQLQTDMLNILKEEHTIQFTVFEEMQKRGWYSPGAAQAQMINETKTKFENIATQL